eukprot:Lankesteria_metandrocarpae@DN687_c0_g1_i1.p1
MDRVYKIVPTGDASGTPPGGSKRAANSSGGSATPGDAFDTEFGVGRKPKKRVRNDSVRLSNTTGTDINECGDKNGSNDQQSPEESTTPLPSNFGAVFGHTTGTDNGTDNTTRTTTHQELQWLPHRGEWEALLQDAQSEARKLLRHYVELQQESVSVPVWRGPVQTLGGDVETKQE